MGLDTNTADSGITFGGPWIGMSLKHQIKVSILVATISGYCVIHPASSSPLLKDLYQHITPRYAADWKVIGTLLDLPSGELKSIEAGYPTNVKWCCNQMLEKWLEMDPFASWEKLFKVIESSAVSSDQGSNEGD